MFNFIYYNLDRTQHWRFYETHVKDLIRCLSIVESNLFEVSSGICEIPRRLGSRILDMESRICNNRHKSS